MKAYTCQIGEETSGTMTRTSYAEDIHAYSFIEAIEKTKAIVLKRPPHRAETVVHLLDDEADPKLVWSRPMAEIRDA